MAKFIQYHSQEYQLNLMPLQSINNNQQSMHAVDGDFCSYVLTSDMEMHVNILFVDDFSFLVLVGCAFFSIYVFWLVSSWLVSWIGWLVGLVGCMGFKRAFRMLLCKCARFCMFHDHVCVFCSNIYVLFSCSFGS